MLVGLFVEADTHARRAKAFTVDDEEVLIVSDFAAAEFSSVVAHLVRTKVVTRDAARAVFDNFDAWRGQFADNEDVVSGDIQAATLAVRRLDLNLRAPDAINLAIARRLGASIATFDRGMARIAVVLGIPVIAT